MKFNFYRTLAVAITCAAAFGHSMAQTSQSSIAATPGKKADKPKPRAKLARSAAKAVEEVTPIDNERNIVLDDAALAVAKREGGGGVIRRTVCRERSLSKGPKNRLAR